MFDLRLGLCLVRVRFKVRVKFKNRVRVGMVFKVSCYQYSGGVRTGIFPLLIR